MEKLMTRLEKLSVAIGQLNPASSSKNSPSHSNGGGGMDFGNGNGNHSLNRWQSMSNDSRKSSLSAETKSSSKRRTSKLVRQKESINDDQ